MTPKKQYYKGKRKMSISGSATTAPNYRKIYEQCYGPIPKETNGRSYDIHHIDGDHSNNHPSNLKAIPVREHYNIHYSQQDWGACGLIGWRIGKTHEELSELAKKAQQKRIEEDNHNFLTDEHKEIASRARKKEAEKGELLFQYCRDYDFKPGHDLSRKRVENKTHNWIGPTANKARVEAGTHNFLGPRSTEWIEHHKEIQAERVQAGTHNFLGITNQQIVYECSRCSRSGKGPAFKHRHIINNCII